MEMIRTDKHKDAYTPDPKRFFFVYMLMPMFFSDGLVQGSSADGEVIEIHDQFPPLRNITGFCRVKDFFFNHYGWS